MKIRLLKNVAAGTKVHNGTITLAEGKEGYIANVDDETGKILIEEEKLAEVFKEPDLERKVLFEAFGGDQKMADRGGFKTLGEFCRDIAMERKSGFVSNNLRRYREILHKQDPILQEVGDSLADTLIPPEFRMTLLDRIQAETVILGRGTPMPMRGFQLKIPMVDQTNRHGGIVVYWLDEGDPKTPKKPAFDLVELELHELAGLCYVSDRVLEDSPISIEAILKKLFGDAFVEELDYQMTNGDGTTQPQGYLDSACVVEVPRESAGEVTALDIVTMFSRLDPALIKSAIWVVTPALLPDLMLLVNTLGKPYWMQGDNLAAAPYGILLGRPIFMSESAPAAYARGDLSLCAFSEYLVGQKAGGLTPKFDTSIHVRFLTDETAFRFTLRVDGKCWWASARTPRNAGPTVSPFVVLDDTTP